MNAVNCPKCGECGGVKVDVAGGDACECGECGAEFTVTEVRAVVASWGVLLAWLDSHPAKAK